MIINEIFKSIQGESTHAGRPCVFVRTTACNLRCAWCDTEYAFHEGAQMSVEEIRRKVGEYDCSLVEITGGEPLLQPEVNSLIGSLLDEGREVLVETSGSLPIEQLDPRAAVIMDVKCPGSGMTQSMRWENLDRLRPKDEVKFVIADQADYLFAKETCRAHHLFERCPVLFAPAFGMLPPRSLAEWILQDSLPARLQIQLQKYIWDPSMRGV